MLRFPINIDPNDCDKQVEEILAVLKPEWPKEDIKRKNFSEGYMNVLFCCHLASDPKFQDGVIFRIAYDVDDPKRLLGATKDEIMCNSQIAQAAGSGAPVFALFKNGLVTKCLPGSAANRKHLREEKLIKQIAKLLAQLHCVNVDTVNTTDSEGKEIKIPKKVRFFDDVYHVLESLPDNGKEVPTYPSDEYFSKENIRKEIQFVEKFFGDLGFEVVFAHNDFHSKNLVYDTSADKMMMIDFDISGYNYESYDIGSLLQDKEYALYLGFCGEDDPPNLTDEEISMWAKFYLMAKAEVMGKDPASVTAKDIQIYVLKCKITAPLFHLVSIMWGLGNHDNPEMKATDTFSIVEVSNIARKLYEEGKKKFPEYIARLKQLTES